MTLNNQFTSPHRDYPPWCSIVGATMTVHQFFCILHCCHTCSLFRFELVVQFPARGSTQVLCLFPGVLWLWHFLYSVGPHPVSSLHIYTFVCRGHSWRVRLDKQKTLTPPGHMVSHLVCRGPWMSIMVLYCWCHSDSASVLLYFTLTLLPPLIMLSKRMQWGICNGCWHADRTLTPPDTSPFQLGLTHILIFETILLFVSMRSPIFWESIFLFLPSIAIS